MSDGSSNEDRLRLELYKALMEESRTCREKVTAVWLQKFALLGAMIAFLVTKFADVHGNSALVSAGVLAVPALAILLDVKAAEFAIHAGIIDRFIIQQYTKQSIVSQWEDVKWYSGLAIVRSLATVAVTALPTCITVLLAALVIRHLKQGSADLRFDDMQGLPLGFCVLYCALALIVSCPLLHRGRIARESPKTKNKNP